MKKIGELTIPQLLFYIGVILLLVSSTGGLVLLSYVVFTYNAAAGVLLFLAVVGITLVGLTGVVNE